MLHIASVLIFLLILRYWIDISLKLRLQRIRVMLTSNTCRYPRSHVSYSNRSASLDPGPRFVTKVVSPDMSASIKIRTVVRPSYLDNVN